MTYTLSSVALATPIFAALGAMAAIGPITDLHVSNVVLSPDGYSREYVSFIDLVRLVLTPVLARSSRAVFSPVHSLQPILSVLDT